MILIRIRNSPKSLTEKDSQNLKAHIPVALPKIFLSAEFNIEEQVRGGGFAPPLVSLGLWESNAISSDIAEIDLVHGHRSRASDSRSGFSLSTDGRRLPPLSGAFLGALEEFSG